MKYTIEEAEDWISGQERVVREFKEYQQEQMMQLLTDISSEYKIDILLLNSTIIKDSEGDEISEGKVYDAIWQILDYDEDNIGALGTMIIEHKKIRE